MSQITSLTLSTSLAAGDLLVVVDIDDTTMAATGTDKKLAMSDVKTFVKAGPVSAQAYPANPTATASTTLVMMGIGGTCALTPGSSGKVLLGITGICGTNTAVATLVYGGRYGTGTAPVNGAAVSGTRWGVGAADATVKGTAIGTGMPFAMTDIVTITPGTAYWFDVALDTGVAADTAFITNLSFTALEIS